MVCQCYNGHDSQIEIGLRLICYRQEQMWANTSCRAGCVMPGGKEVIYVSVNMCMTSFSVFVLSVDAAVRKIARFH
jgi:hypothetical protein